MTQQFADMRENAKLYGLISSPNFERNALEMSIFMILEKTDAENKKHPPIDANQNFKRK